MKSERSIVIRQFNLREFTSEDSAIEFFTLRGWFLNSYSGSNGITFSKVGLERITIARIAGTWFA